MRDFYIELFFERLRKRVGFLRWFLSIEVGDWGGGELRRGCYRRRGDGSICLGLRFQPQTENSILCG